MACTNLNNPDSEMEVVENNILQPAFTKSETIESSEYHIKSEITFEPEKISETTFLEFPIEQLNQIEVHTSFENPSADLNNTTEEFNDWTKCNEDYYEEHIVPQLSDVLSDHNYTTQESMVDQHNIVNIKNILVNHIVTNRTSHKSIQKKVSDFIDNTVDSIKTLQLEILEKNKKTKSTEENRRTDDIKSPDSVGSNILEKTQIAADSKQSITLSENCSEPLEIEPNDDYFENLYKSSERASVSQSTLNDTIYFAKQLLYECNVFATKTEEEFKIFLLQQVKKLQSIANVDCKDQVVQTYNSLKKRRRINNNTKRRLLETSDSSNLNSEFSSSENDRTMNTSTRCVSDESLAGSVRTIRHKLRRSPSSCKNINHNAARLAQDYSDGIDLSKYIKLDITNRNYRQSSSDSDKENKQKIIDCTTDDDTDKEIERLTNLSGLSKRHAQNKQAKIRDGEKSKPKALGKKNTNNKYDLMDDDLDTYNTDNSLKQSEDEAITENQYLLRYNEQIKMQLLNESNTDSGLSDQSDYNLIKESSSENENDDKSDVVDKFLQTFKSDKSEPDEANEDDEMDGIKDNNEKLSPEEKKKESYSLEESDLQLDKNLTQRKRTNVKSLEKMLAEAEKRTKSDEIVLSSESDFSDVETVEAEPIEEKSRFIKPMLRMDQLANETRVAQKSETERIRRLEKKHSVLSKAVKSKSASLNESDLILDFIESTKTFIKVHEDIVKDLKPHQIDGVRFMYDSCYGGADHTKKNSGSGCILAHCMGLGKTLQLIALLHTVITYKELNTTKILVLCPKSTVMNWADELQRWLGPLKKTTRFKVFVFPDSSDISEKLRVLEEWSLSSEKSAGCLLVGYEAFRALVFYHSYKNRGSHSPAKLENIRDKVIEYLLEPGADLVVCDEGHIIKNSKSAISLAVSKIVTPKRIILTGTPIQNNLKEYYSMVNFIKPLYLGTEKEFANLYANPIKNGQHKDSSKKDITVMKQRSYVLHKKLSKFVQRKEAELLKTFLPEKYEYVLFVPMTTVQITLYEYILEAIASRGDSRGKSLITDYTVLRKIWTHPKVLEDAWKNANLQKNKKDVKKIPSPHSDDDQPDDIYDSQTGLISVNNDWWRRYLSTKDLETIMPSNKLRTMFAILRMCEEMGDKCLIFSAFVAVLNVVEYFFKKITDLDPETLQNIHIPTKKPVSNTWINGQDYYRLDGKTPKNIRHEMIKRFNSENNARARVFLISAKAGGQGINLIGANRVIILDTSWNPSNDQQNIFRIFRLGQKKNCFIYRLIAMGTMEEKVYSRSVTKQAMSFRVVDEQQIDRHYNMAELAELYTLTNPEMSDRIIPVLPKDPILAHLLLSQPELIYKYHEHDSLLENKEEQELSEQEKADAWATYERELNMNLAQQDGLSAEKALNPFASKMPPYLGSMPNLDMHTLLSYSLQSASLIPQYSYGMNPNYIDTLNMYQKYSSMRYPDLNSCLADKNYASSAFNALNAQQSHSHLQTSASILSNMQNMAAAKTLQSEFGMFDVNSQKTRTSGAMNLPPLPHSMPPDIATSSLAAAITNSSSLLPNLGQYKQLLENPLTSLLNYSAQSYAPSSVASTVRSGNTPLGMNAMHNMLPSSVYPEKPIDEDKNMTQSDKRVKPDHIRNARTSLPQDLSQNLSTQSTTTSVDLTQSNDPRTISSAALPITTASTVLKKPVSAINTVMPAMQAQNNVSSMSNHYGNEQKKGKPTRNTNVNLPVNYADDKSSSLSGRGEMQIIPTTSPPGTSSISKQLNQMSPSISLTAVNTSREKPTPAAQFLHHAAASTTSADANKTNNKTMANSAKSNRKAVYPRAQPLPKPQDNFSSSLSISTVTPAIQQSVHMAVPTTQSLATSVKNSDRELNVTLVSNSKTVSAKKNANSESLSYAAIPTKLPMKPTVDQIKSNSRTSMSLPKATTKLSTSERLYEAIRAQGTTLSVATASARPTGPLPKATNLGISYPQVSLNTTLNMNNVKKNTDSNVKSLSEAPQGLIRKRPVEELKGNLNSKRTKLLTDPKK